MSDTRLIEAALAAGAAGAVLIPQRQIVLSAEFRRICEGNGCGYYGRCWMCPPDTGDIETAMAQVRRYPWALLYQTIGAIEDSFDIEGMEERAREHARVSQRVQQAVGLLHERARTSEAAEKTGFTDYKHFCSVFKRCTGLTPRECLRGSTSHSGAAADDNQKG